MSHDMEPDKPRDEETKEPKNDEKTETRVVPHSGKEAQNADEQGDGVPRTYAGDDPDGPDSTGFGGVGQGGTGGG